MLTRRRAAERLDEAERLHEVIPFAAHVLPVSDDGGSTAAGQLVVEEVLDVYFSQCAIAMSCVQLARSGLFLAAGGSENGCEPAGRGLGAGVEMAVVPTRLEGQRRVERAIRASRVVEEQLAGAWRHRGPVDAGEQRVLMRVR